jgi:hypothetical protein
LKAPRVLILSRDLLLDSPSSVSKRAALFRHLAHLTRAGCRLILTAAEPLRWLPTRGSEDSALRAQKQIQEQLRRHGGDLDGIYYVRHSEMTQDRRRRAALRDLLQRYAIPPGDALLLSANPPFLSAAEELGIRTLPIAQSTAGAPAGDRDTGVALERALASLNRSA